MHRCALVAWSLVAAAAAQEPTTPVGRVVAVLQHADPARDGKGVDALLGAQPPLDAAIEAVAASAQSGQLVRLRALRLARALQLAQRLRQAAPQDPQQRLLQDPQQRQPQAAPQRDVAFWLAFDELVRELPAALRPALLQRTGMDAAAVEAAQRQLAAASAVVDRFCVDWNETRWMDEAHAAENRRYDALEAELKAAGAAAVPRLLGVLSVPPDVAFSGWDPEQDVTARQQVRALLALSAVLRVPEALPYCVMHTGGPSLTQGSNAAMAVQLFAGRDFGAALHELGDEDALLQWWRAQTKDHRFVLDHLVQHVVRLVERMYQSQGAKASVGLWCAVVRLERAMGRDVRPAADAGVELLEARLRELELQALLHGR